MIDWSKMETMEQKAEKKLADRKAYVRSERDRRLAAVEWRVDRYRDQREQGIVTSDTEEQYKAVLEYMQTLRDLPSQEGFPWLDAEIPFPVEPNFEQEE